MGRHDSNPPVALDPPGAGVPVHERWVGRLAAAVLPRLWSWESIPDRMDRQGATILGLLPPPDDPRLHQPVLVPRFAGLEDSSRFWSPVMVLEHLALIGRRMIPIIVALSREQVPDQVTRIAELKPRGEQSGAFAIDDFQRMLAEFRQAVLHEVVDRRARARYPHPWFGPLNVRQWLVFAPFHQAIHVRQMRSMAAAIARD